MTANLAGYARCSTAGQDLTAQQLALQALGVDQARVYVDQGMTGTNRARPGLREAIAATRAGDTLVVTKLDRLARSIRDARDIVAELTGAGVRLQIGASVHDPADPVGRLLLNVLAMVAEFEGDLIRSRTREGWLSPAPRDDYAGAPQSSPALRSATWLTCTAAAATPLPRSPNCSASHARPSTAQSSARPIQDSEDPRAEVEASLELDTSAAYLPHEASSKWTSERLQVHQGRRGQRRAVARDESRTQSVGALAVPLA